MLVAGLATAAELFAPLGHGKAPATGEYHESIDLFHKVTLVQGVALGVTYLPGLSVTYLAGSNPVTQWKRGRPILGSPCHF